MKSNDGSFVSHPPFDFQELLQLVELMKSTSQFSEFRLRANGFELELRRGPAGEGVAASNGAAPMSPSLTQAAPAATATGASMPPQDSQPHRRAQTRAHAEGLAVVAAPMVGTVYLSPEPGAPPFVAVGQPVEAGTQLCIVEVMKLMNSITADCKGVVSDILVDDAEAVEFGQALFVITPA